MAYRKIDSRIWNDAKFRDLSDNAKLLFFMLLTHPNMTSLGAMRATLSGLAEEIGWSPEAFREAFQEASSKGMAKHDSKTHFLYLPNFIKYNSPESPNVVKAWDKSLDLLPECDLKDRVIEGAKAFLEGKSKGFREALPEAFAKGMPNQEQEQEQEQEQDITQGAQARPSDPKKIKRVDQVSRHSGSGSGPPAPPDDKKPKRFTPPSVTAVAEYFRERGCHDPTEPAKFVDFYESKGWMVGKNKMKNWQAAVRNWLTNNARPRASPPENATRDRPLQDDLTDRSWAPSVGTHSARG